MKNLNIVFFGSGDLGLEILKSLSEKFTIKVVVTQSDKPAGRGKNLAATPIGNLAEKLNLKVIKIDNLDKDFLEKFKESLNADLFLVVSFGKIIPQGFLDLPKFGTINIHPSLLPKYRGASPIQSAILNGEEKSGFSIMLLDAQMDHGPIIYAKEFSLSEEDTHETLSNKVSLEVSKLLPAVLEEFVSGKIKPKVQNHAIATYCNQIKKEDGYFDINNLPAGRQTPQFYKKLDKMIRAYFPWPNVWTRWSPSAKATGDKNGKIVKFYPQGLVQMEGKNKISLKDFLNGYPNFPIKSL